MNWHSDIPLALSYDDVMLVPRRSRISSRRDVDTSTQLTRQLRLAVPLVSANMDTVTESAMAIAMARVGGIGIIHRFLTVDAQAREVAKVKRAEAPVIDDPHRIADDAPIREAHAMIRERGVSGLVVVDRRDHLVGMLTSRDLGMVPDAEFVRDAMTPRERLVVGEAGTPRDVALAMMRQARVEKLPLVDSEGRLVGLVTMRDMVTHAQRRETTTDARGHLAVGAAIGVRGDYLDRARALVEAGADVLVLDIAHGHAEHAVAAVSKVREGIGNDAVGIIAGNVATPTAPATSSRPVPTASRWASVRARCAPRASSPESVCRSCRPCSPARPRARIATCRSSPTAVSGTPATSPRPSGPGPPRS